MIIEIKLDGEVGNKFNNNLELLKATTEELMKLNERRYFLTELLTALYDNIKMKYETEQKKSFVFPPLFTADYRGLNIQINKDTMIIEVEEQKKDKDDK